MSKHIASTLVAATSLYIRLTVEYIGCSVEVVLQEDKPYILRTDETVVR